MGDTSIQWTDVVWNATRGCSRISPGCGGARGKGGCYAERMAIRLSGPGRPYEGLVQVGKQGVRWTGKLVLDPKVLAVPLSWKKPRRVFVNSMSDLFHEALTNEEIAAVFGVMAATPTHTYQVLTKRADRMAEWFRWMVAKVSTPQSKMHEGVKRAMGYDHPRRPAVNTNAWPLPNVHLGVSVESPDYLDRLDFLRACPAALRWASVEPQLADLGPVNLDGIGWIVQGGESGPGARPFDLAWARSLRDQCRTARVAFFLKQLGKRPMVSGTNPDGLAWEAHAHPDINGIRDDKGGDEDEWPDDLRGLRAWPEVRS